MTVKKAVIPAAGLGTRLLPATTVLPKEMLPLVDTPVIQYVVKESLEAGLDDLLIVTRRGKTALEDHLDSVAGGTGPLQGSPRGVPGEMACIHFVRQAKPLGLGHAVLQARFHVGHEAFALLLGDEVFRSRVPCIRQVMEAQAILGGSVLAVQEVCAEDTWRYGIVDAVQVSPGVSRVTDLIEKPGPSKAPSNLAITGRYVLEPEVFHALQGAEPGVRGEIELTDALRSMVRMGLSLWAIQVDACRYDTGDRLGLLRATVEMALDREDIGPSFRRYLEGIRLAGSSDPTPG
jgi:UTP--glucose-1-phosphate uridylyltransferase